MRKTKVPDREVVRAALESAHGIQAHAAAALAVPRSTLQQWLSKGPFEDLLPYAEALRADYAPQSHGRPWTTDERRTRAAVADAWEKSGYRLSVAARNLGLPRTSLRHLLHRYGLPNLPAAGRRKPGDGDDGAGSDGADGNGAGGSGNGIGSNGAVG